MELIFAFFQDNGYVLELLICTLIFSWWQKRRRLYGVRLVLSSAVILLIAALINPWMQTHTQKLVLNYLWFALLLLNSLFLYQISVKVALFVCVGGFVGQHMAFKVGEMVRYLIYPFVSTEVMYIVYVLVEALMYVVLYLIFARRFRNLNVRNARHVQLALLYCAVAVYITLLQFVFSRYWKTLPDDLFLAYALLDMICCAFAMMLQFSFIESSFLQDESRLMQHVLHMQQDKYQMSKEAMGLINVRFHDMKKLLAGMPALDETDTRKLWEAMRLYDMSIKSGNEALDVLLAEKSLVCQQHGVRLECVADGAQLAFMHAADIYSLLGNALDNAIEAACKVSGQRFITLSVHKACDLLVIQMENPFEGKLRFHRGLPVTTREEGGFHGFGMKSMQMVVEKYSGYFSICTDNGIFALTIVFPPNLRKADGI